MAISIVASLGASATSQDPESPRPVHQNGWLAAVGRFALEPAPTWVIVLAVAAVLLAAGALAYVKSPAATGDWVSSDLLPWSLVVVVAAMALLARTARRLRTVQKRDSRAIPEDIRAEPHTSPVDVTVEYGHDNAPTFTIPVEPGHDASIQTLPAGDLRTAARPLTAAAFLFGEDQDTTQALALVLEERGALHSVDTALQFVSQARRQATDSQLAFVAHGVLDLDLGDLLVAGWRKQGELVAAAERTAANPGSSEVVELASHRIGLVHHPFVELLVNDVHVATVDFVLHIEFVVKALVVTVRDGEVVSLHSGSCEVAATLAAEDVQLASRRAHLKLPLVIRLPLLLRPGVSDDPLPPFGAKPPPARPSWRRRTPGDLIPWRRRDRRRRTRPGPPAD